MGEPAAPAASTRTGAREARAVRQRREERALVGLATRLLADVDLAAGRAAVVAILTGPGGQGDQVARALAVRLPEVRVAHVQALRVGTPHRVALGAIGAPHLVLDATGDRTGAAQRLRSCFLLLGQGGRYVAPHRVLPDPPYAGGPLTGAVTAVDHAGGVTVVTSGGGALLKVRDRGMNAALRADPTRGAVVAEVAPARHRDGDASTRGTTAERSAGEDQPRTYDAPAMYLREYHDVVCAPRSIVVQRNLITPDTFRHIRDRALHRDDVEDLDKAFARAPFSDADVAALDGVWFHLDNEHRGHFGHALTEQVSRLWGYQLARSAAPGVRVLMGSRDGRPLASWERLLFEAAGIPPEDITTIEGPVRVARLLSATPMYAMPHYVHPRIVETWDAVGERLRARASGGRQPRRIFVSRRHGTRACVNREEVESLFEQHGFEVVFPEELPLPDQVQMFHEAEVVGGFAGSGMFTVMFSDRPKHLITVSSTSYLVRNEEMIATVRGHRLDQVRSKAHREHPPGGRSRWAAQSPFRFDPVSEGRQLHRILAGL